MADEVGHDYSSLFIYHLAFGARLDDLVAHDTSLLAGKALRASVVTQYEEGAVGEFLSHYAFNVTRRP